MTIAVSGCVAQQEQKTAKQYSAERYYGYISLKCVRLLNSTNVFVSSVLCNKFKLESALEHRMDKNCVVMKIRMYFFKIKSVY